MNKTQIEWCRNPDSTQGYTWNPITGCLNHIDGMCKGGNFPCYAYRLAHGRLKERYCSNAYLAPNSTSQDYIDPFYPRFWEDKLFDPMTSRKIPKGIFVCDMSDLFGVGVPEQWTDHVMTTIKCCPDHRFYLLTKQPQNLIKFSPFLDNCDVGVTATANAFLTNALIGLRIIKAKHKFISFEPLLGDVGMNDHMKLTDAGVGRVIIGAQTKPYKPPKIEWVREIVEAADRASIPVFLKDNLKPILLKLSVHDPKAACAEKLLDSGGRLRQEMPE